MKNILLILSLLIIAIPCTINISYSQNDDALKMLAEGFNDCIAENYLVNQTNIKIIDILLIDTINNVCVDDVNQLLEKNYTIKGTLLDKYIILEKIK